MYILFIFNNFNNMYEKCNIKYFVSLLTSETTQQEKSNLEYLIVFFLENFPITS